MNSLFPYDMSYIFYSSPAQWEKLGKDWVKVALQPSGTGPFKVDRVVRRGELDRVALECDLSHDASPWIVCRYQDMNGASLRQTAPRRCGNVTSVFQP